MKKEIFVSDVLIVIQSQIVTFTFYYSIKPKQLFIYYFKY